VDSAVVGMKAAKRKITLIEVSTVSTVKKGISLLLKLIIRIIEKEKM
jgi:hypothetical protein